ncbi:MAG: enoyl-CoA hydratase/isomerase family protein, partial [bacterium]|nr:enoyl-CoA hydratase/isomerase family protein [bacterium]
SNAPRPAAATTGRVMTYDFFDCEVRDGVATLSLFGPSAPSLQELGDELVDALLRLQEDRAARVILLSDGGGPFDTAMDLRAAAEAQAGDAGMGTVAADLDTIRRVVTLMQELGKPIVAAVAGDVRDSGFGLVMAADVRLAAATATFTTQDMRLGLLPDWGLTSTLPRAIGPNRALDVLWSGRTLSADEASRLGLLDRVFTPQEFEQEVEAYCRRLAGIPQPALRLSKLAVQQSSEFDLTTMLSLEYEAQQQCWDSRETTAGLMAGLDGDDPDFGIPGSEDDD